MPKIEIKIEVVAPIERVFDLARCIDLHEKSMSQTNERAVGGVTRGLIGLDEEVTWEATHFGVRQRLTSRITAFDRPRHFRDEMVRGAFASFVHDHEFQDLGDGRTLMKDVFDYRSPLWILGRIADVLFLERYMRNLLIRRNLLIKQTAESTNWMEYSL